MSLESSKTAIDSVLVASKHVLSYVSPFIPGFSKEPLLYQRSQCSKRSEQGTLIQIPASIDSAHFQAVAREAIAAAQAVSPDSVGA